MENALGFHILWNAWNYLLAQQDYDSMHIVRNAQSEVISATDAAHQPVLRLMLAVNAWHRDHEVEGVKELIND